MNEKDFSNKIEEGKSGNEAQERELSSEEMKTEEELRQAREELRASEKGQEFNKRVGEIFNKYENGEDRVNDILLRIKHLFSSNLIDGVVVRQSLEECSNITDRDEFIDKVYESLGPLIDLEINKPREFGAIQRKAFIEKGSFVKINEILSYGGSGDSIHLHLAPAKELGVGELRGLVRDGLKELAKIVEENKEIKEITATSWIVAAHPKILEKLGFAVGDEIDEDAMEQYFTIDGREIQEASITREELLDKYLKE